MKKVRLGVVGCGVIGQIHIKIAAASELISLTAVADINGAAARDVAQQLNIPNHYDTAAALINDRNVDAVLLAIPTTGRTALGLKALALGKHVLLEKPGGMDAVEVETLIRAQGQQIAACCSSRFRYLTSAGRITEFIASGALGNICVLHVRVHVPAELPPAKTPPAWRLKKSVNGGGILVNWGCYDLDYMLGITGWTLRPRTVLAKTWQVPPPFETYIAVGSDAETYYTALATCDNGAVLSIERSEYATAHAESAWQIVGTKGALNLVMTAGHEKQIVFDEAVPGKGVVPRTIWQGADDPAPILSGPVTDFAEAIMANRAPKTTLEQYLTIQKIFDAIYKSSASGKAITIP